MKSRSFLAALLLLVLCACANVSSDFKFDPTKSTGIVVGSISYESGLGRFVLVATPTAGGQAVSFAFGCSLVPCLTSSDDQAFSRGEMPKQRGGGFAVEVPEGEYRITGWRVMRGAMHSASASPVDLRFTVERGKASYIGNLHFDADWENVQLRDKALRDLPLLQAQYPVLKAAPLAFTIADGVVIEHVGGGYQTRMEMPVYVPVFRAK